MKASVLEKVRPELRCLVIGEKEWNLIKDMALENSCSISAMARFLIKEEHKRRTEKSS